MKQKEEEQEGEGQNVNVTTKNAEKGETVTEQMIYKISINLDLTLERGRYELLVVGIPSFFWLEISFPLDWPLYVSDL